MITIIYLYGFVSGSSFWSFPDGAAQHFGSWDELHQLPTANNMTTLPNTHFEEWVILRLNQLYGIYI